MFVLRQPRKLNQLKTLITLVLFLMALGAFAGKAQAQCTATSAQVCGVADDYMSIWIDGIQVGSGNDFRFAHVNCPNTNCAIGSCGAGPAWGVCTPVCVSVSAAILALITANPNNVVIAAKVQTPRTTRSLEAGTWMSPVPEAITPMSRATGPTHKCGARRTPERPPLARGLPPA